MKYYNLKISSERQKFYKCKDWRKLRGLKLLYNPLCEWCEKKNLLIPGTEIDHIIPIVISPHLALRFDNLQTLCSSCHAKKTNEENLPPTKLYNKMWNF